MKTKKRLQALVLVTAMLAALCGSFPTVSAETALPGPFQASEAYVASAAGNPAGPWQWNYYDKTEAKYEKLPYFVSGGRGFSIVNNFNNCTAVDQSTMYADMRKNGTGEATEDAWTRYYPVRTFTAPNSGNITISAGGALTGGGAYSGPNVRIMLEHSGEFSQVWPSEGWQVVKSNASVNFVPLTRNITAGDKLHFELSGEHLASNAISSAKIKVNWDPIVTYNSLSLVMPEYQSSEAFVAEAGKYNQPPWQWEAYDTNNSAYAPLTGGTTVFDNSKGSYPVPAGDEDGAFCFKRAADNASAAVGKYWMTPDRKNKADLKRYYAVRTFTAPNTGNITISAAGITNADTDKILGQVKGTGKGGDVRLMLESGGTNTQIWPESGWRNVPRSGNTIFSPLKINVKEGDKLHFEAADSTEKGSTNYDQAVYWDPKITYNSYMELDSFLPEDINRVTLDQTFTLTAKNAMSGTVTAEDVSITGGSGNASVKTATMSNENKTISFSFDGLEFGKSYTVTIKDPTDTAVILYRFTFTTLNVLYTSNEGTENGDGTTASPLSFQKALELAKDGDKIMVTDEIVLPSDFAWPTAKKHVTVSGEGFAGAALNIYILASTALNVNTNTTFKNLVFASTEAGDADKVGRINAMGNVVTLEESVSTRGIFGSFYGGAANNWSKVEKTESYVYGGNFSRIFGGGGQVLGDCILTVGGNTNINGYGHPSDESNKFAPIIYGGTYDNTVEGDCITTITGSAEARMLYGGSLDVRGNADRGAGVKGKTVVNIQGGKFMNVYGMNPPSSKESGGTVDYSSYVTINMTGGTVEALIGSSGDTNTTAINGTVTINAVGGTVTRRIIGGVYNEDGWNSDSGMYITGDVNVVIGSGLNGFTDKQTGHGIFGGSRINTNPAGENAKLIFLGGSYDTFKKHINADKIDCESHHDYLITGTAGGTIVPGSGNCITVTPDEGYVAYIGGESVQENYTLAGARTDVVFTNDGPPPAIFALGGTAAENSVQATISYTAAADTNILILALYDNNSLVAVEQPSVTQVTHTTENVSISYAPKSGTAYTIKAFLWNGMENIVPLCEARSAEIIVQ